MKNDMTQAKAMIDGIAPAPNPEVFGSADNDVLADRAAHVKDGVQYNALGLESTADHKNVSKAWQETGCTPIKEFAAKIYHAQSLKHDDLKPYSYLRLDEELRLPDGKRMTMRGLMSLVGRTAYPGGAVPYYLGKPDGGAEIARRLNEELAANHEEWVEKKNSRKTSKFADQEEQNILVRCRPDMETGEDVVRFFGTEKYGVINNSKVMEMLLEAFKISPYGGDYTKALASHTYDDGDMIHGNILLPDQMKPFPDSDYGVGIAFSNSEIGQYTMRIEAFLFRAICSNGCIWSRLNASIGINKKHSGEIDFDDLFIQICNAVNIALTEGNNFITQMQMSNNIHVPMDKVPSVITYLADSNPGMTVAMAKAWMKGFAVEQDETAHKVVNGLTQAAHRYHGEDKRIMQVTAGNILTPSLNATPEQMQKHWDRILDRASDMTEKKIRKYTVVGAEEDED